MAQKLAQDPKYLTIKILALPVTPIMPPAPNVNLYTKLFFLSIGKIQTIMCKIYGTTMDFYRKFNFGPPVPTNNADFHLVSTWDNFGTNNSIVSGGRGFSDLVPLYFAHDCLKN